MFKLLENNVIDIKNSGANLMYIFNNENDFLQTEYKVLQSQNNSCFINCMKILYNGKITLFYKVDTFKPLDVVIRNIDAEKFILIMSNLIFDILNVKSNGFLTCQNMDLSLKRIYVDTTTFKVSFIYLPVRQRIYDDYSAFENEIRVEIIKLISQNQNLNSAKINRLESDLSNGTLTLEDIYMRIKGSGPIDFEPPQNKELIMSIVSLNSQFRTEIEITKDKFVIGKNPQVVDGVISFNNLISRVHCKIEKSGQTYTITDLKSANGTFVNRIRLQPNKAEIISNGDVIRLANSDFQIKMK